MDLIEQYLLEAPMELTIKNVEQWYTEIKDKLSSPGGVLINLIGVIEIDTAGFQLLVSIKREMLETGRSFNVVGMSIEVDEILSLYNAEAFLNS